MGWKEHMEKSDLEAVALLTTMSEVNRRLEIVRRWRLYSMRGFWIGLAISMSVLCYLVFWGSWHQDRLAQFGEGIFFLPLMALVYFDQQAKQFLALKRALET